MNIVFKGLVIILCLFYTLSGVHCQSSNNLDIRYYMSRPSAPDLTDGVDYVSVLGTPMIHLEIGKCVYSKNKRIITPHLGAILVREQYIKPSIFEGYSSNTPSSDTIYQRKTFSGAFLSFGAEYKQYFNSNLTGVYLSMEPRFSILLNGKQGQTIRHNNRTILDESSQNKSRFNAFNAVLVIGGGYHLSLSKRVGLFLALHLEFRPFRGYYANEDFLWVSPGLSTGLQF